jgi:hypothetical protein
VSEPKKQEEKLTLKDTKQSEVKKNEEVVVPAKVGGYAAALLRGGLTPTNETKVQSSQSKESIDAKNPAKEEKSSKPKRTKNQNNGEDKWQKVENKKNQKKKREVCS